MDENIDEPEELWYEPEWCGDCSTDMEKRGLEYTFDYYIKDDMYYCEHCGQPL